MRWKIKVVISVVQIEDGLTRPFLRIR
jgi:hypothetical protein